MRNIYPFPNFDNAGAVPPKSLELVYFEISLTKMSHDVKDSHTPQQVISWWRHKMETFSVLLALSAENSPVNGEFPSQSPVTRSFDVFFDLLLNKRLNKQSRRLWFEIPSRSWWRRFNYQYNNEICHISVAVQLDMSLKSVHNLLCISFPIIQVYWVMRITTNTRDNSGFILTSVI